MNTPSLALMCESLSYSDRAAMAVAHGVDNHDIDTIMHDVSVWPRIMERFSQPTRAIVARMRRAGGVLPASLLESIAGPLRTNLESISPRAFLTIHHPLTPLEHLFVSGVVWPTKTPQGSRQWSIPAEIESALGPIPALFVPESPQPNMTASVMPSLDEIVVTAACLAIDGRMPLQQHGRISPVALNRLGRDDVSLTVMHWLSSCWLSAGVFRVDTNGLTPTPRLLEWLSDSPHERVQELTRAWLQASWNEWELAKSKKRPPALDIRYARRTIVYALLSHLPDGWCAWSEVIDGIRLGWPDMVRPANPQGKWQVPPGWPQTWESEDGPLIEYMLRGPAQWLGLVEWDELGVFVRRTSLGGWIAGVTPPPSVAPPKPAILEADGSVVIVDTTNYYARVQLHRIADWRDAHTAYISPARVRKAIAAGMSSATYLDILQSVIATPIPSMQASIIRSWATDVSQVTAQAMVIIQSRSADVMVDIIHDRQVALPEYQLLNDTTIALAPNSAAMVIRRLQQAGYVVDVQGIKSPQFDESELALIAQLINATTTPHDEQTRQLHRKIAQLRRKGASNG
ncbi:MAG: hypothetical protein RI985_854 [Chloroflexota bacterium]|jgi:hypothetical protein